MGAPFGSDKERRGFFAQLGSGSPSVGKTDYSAEETARRTGRNYQGKNPTEKNISDHFKKTYSDSEKEKLREKVASFKVSSTGQPQGTGKTERTGYKEGILGIPFGQMDQEVRSKSRPTDYIPKTNPIRQMKEFADQRRIDSEEG